MGNMLIDDHQSGTDLCEDVLIVQLPDPFPFQCFTLSGAVLELGLSINRDRPRSIGRGEYLVQR